MTKQEQIEQLKSQLAQLEREMEAPECDAACESCDHTEENRNMSTNDIEDAEVVSETITREGANEQAQQELEMQTIIYLGKTKAGGVLFQVEGDPDLLIVDGLLDYAKREVDVIYEDRRNALRAQQMSESQEEDQ